MSRQILLAALITLTTLASTSTSAQRYPWDDNRRNAASAADNEAFEDVSLGTQRVTGRDERIEFKIPEEFSRIVEFSVRTLNQRVLLDYAEIKYVNGATDRADILNRLRDGEVSQAIEIRRKNPRVKSIVIWKRPSWRRTKGKLELLGVVRPPPRRGPIADDFRTVVRKRVARQDSRVEFRLGDIKQRFKAISFRNPDRRMLINTAAVIFGNGERRVYNIRQRIGRGEPTKPIEFKKPRRIKKVELWKRPRFRRGSVHVELLGLEAPDRRRPPIWGGIGDDIPADWVLFGAQKVNFKADRDSITVGREIGRFEHIALRIFDNDIFLRELTIVYGNGQRDRRTVDTAFFAGTQTRPIALDGNRFIRKIELLYRARPGKRRVPATVEVYGDLSKDWLQKRYGGNRKKPTWTLLGAQRATLLKKDTDRIVVGKRFGRIRSVKLTARRSTLKVYSVQAKFGNGDVKNLPLTGKLKKGRSTKVVELGGRRGRFIESLVIRYRSKLTLKGPGIIEAWGLN